MMNFKRVLILGGSGSWGREITHQLLRSDVSEIIIFSRGEIAQVDMSREYTDPRVIYVIGDIRDKDAVDSVMGGIDIVFQLAALKHVPICENQPREAIKTNVFGVLNTIDSAIRNKVKRFIDVSTDKAADPANLYGYTKAIGEKLTIQANSLTRETEFICIRAGNVLGTNGSLVPFILNRINTVNSVTLTDDRMTRFFLTVSQAVELLLHAANFGIGGEVYVMNMPAFKIIDLIEILVSYYGDKDTKINISGAREGEKLHEVLIASQELNRAYKYDDNYFVIRPQIRTGRDYPELTELIEKPLTSEVTRGKEELTELLRLGGWL